MALFCLISAGGSTGVTTTALAVALGWPDEVVLAECDPSGRRILPGFLADRLEGPPRPGLLGLAMALARDTGDEHERARIEEFTLPLTDHGTASLLHGIRDPRHARQMDWPVLAAAFNNADVDVIADLGRVGGLDTPVDLLKHADVVVMVLQRTLAQVDAAQPRLDALRVMLGSGVPMGLCLIDEGRYARAEVQKALFDLPVLAELPYARADARVLSDGARPRLAFRTCLLMRTTVGLGRAMREIADEHATGSLPVQALTSEIGSP